MKALTSAQKATRKSAIGFFLNIACAAAVIYGTGMDSWGDWLYLSWCVLCIIGCAYYVQADIKKALRQEEDDA